MADFDLNSLVSIPTIEQLNTVPPVPPPPPPLKICVAFLRGSLVYIKFVICHCCEKTPFLETFIFMSTSDELNKLSNGKIID